MRSAEIPDAPMVGRGVQLVPLAPEHLSQLRHQELSASLAFRWRHAGEHPSPEAFAAGIWSDTLCNFLVIGGSDSPPLGIVSAYGADLRNGHCRLGAARFSLVGASPGFIRGVFLVVEYLFMGWPFRKLYLEAPEYNLGQFGRATETLLEEEARLTDHIFLDDRYWDLIFLSVHRKAWTGHRERLGQFIHGAAEKP